MVKKRSIVSQLKIPTIVHVETVAASLGSELIERDDDGLEGVRGADPVLTPPVVRVPVRVALVRQLLYRVGRRQVPSASGVN